MTARAAATLATNPVDGDITLFLVNNGADLDLN